MVTAIYIVLFLTEYSSSHDQVRATIVRHPPPFLKGISLSEKDKKGGGTGGNEQKSCHKN